MITLYRQETRDLYILKLKNRTEYNINYFDSTFKVNAIIVDNFPTLKKYRCNNYPNSQSWQYCLKLENLKMKLN